VLAACAPGSPDSGEPAIEWPVYGCDLAATRWSPAEDITPDNVRGLKRAWTWATGEIVHVDSTTGDRLAPGFFEATPLMVGDTLYLSTPFSRAVALDAVTGRELWAFDPEVTRSGLVGNEHSGFVHRGVALWGGAGSDSDREDGDGNLTPRRVFLNARWQLFALDARTGMPIGSFGENGAVDLTRGLRWPVNRQHFGQTSPPVVWRDIVIVGSSIGDALVYERDPPGDVQAFDARSGKRLWRWDPVPGVDDPARSSWGGQSAELTGHANVWAPFSLDEVRGLVYLPVSTPSNDWYGGRRPGDNLWAESIVCLDARTGRQVWARQLVHHGLWDYDLSSPPALVTAPRDGADIDAVLVAGKTGFLYGFDRVTGEPLWPIEERAVPGSDVPGEVASATQPTPSWPEPFAQQGFTESDIVDFTPKIREMARELLQGRRLGPMFTPPSLEGTVVMPGWIGGAGWGALTVDPIRGVAFIKATNKPSLARLVKADEPVGYRRDTASGSIDKPITLLLPSWRSWWIGKSQETMLPLSKPPYGTLSAYELSSGKRLWQVPLGDIPEVRSHPWLRALRLPPLGVPGAPGGVATQGGLIFITGGGKVLYAVDQRDGAVRWSSDLGAIGYSNPMTYRARDGRQYVVVATGKGAGARLQAFVLPRPRRAEERL